MNFDALRSGGYSDTDIVESLRSNDLLKDTADFDGLRKKGIGDTQIVEMLNALPSFHDEVKKRKENYLSSQPPKEPSLEIPQNNEGDREALADTTVPTAPQTPPPPTLPQAPQAPIFEAPSAPTMPPPKDDSFLGSIKEAGQSLLDSIFKTGKEIRRDVIKPIEAGMANVIDGVTGGLLDNKTSDGTVLPSETQSAYAMNEKDRATADVVEAAKVLSNSQLLIPALFGDKEENANEAFDKISKALIKTKIADDVEMNQNNELFIIKDGKHYKVEDGFFKNLPSMLESYKNTMVMGGGGAILGAAVATARNMPNPYIRAAGMAGSMIGSMVGVGKDMYDASGKTGLDLEAQHVINKMSEEGTLSLVGDLFINKAADVIPRVYHDVKDFFASENIGAVKKILKNSGYKDAEIGELVSYVEHYQPVEQGATFDSKRAWQDVAFDIAYQDKVLFQHLKDVARENPDLARKLSTVIEDRAKNVTEQGRGVAGRDAFKEALDDYAQRTSAEFGDTLNLFDDALPMYKFSLDDTLADHIQKLQKSVGDTDIKSELDALLYRVRSVMEQEGGLSASDMLKVRKDVNGILRKSGVKRYDDKGALIAINESIDQQLTDALHSSPVIAKEHADALLKQFDDVNTGYKEFIELQDSYLWKQVNAENLPSEAQYDSLLLKVAETEIDDARRLIEKLNPQMQADLQARMVNAIVNKFAGQTDNGTKFVDFAGLGKALETMTYKIEDEGALAFIDNLKVMSKIFKNDELLQKALMGSSGKTEGGNIATDVIGKGKMWAASRLWDNVKKYLPTKKGNFTAFEHHLLQSLERSRDVRELALNIAEAPDMPASMAQVLKPVFAYYRTATEKLTSQIMRAKEAQEEMKSRQAWDSWMGKTEQKQIGTDTPPNLLENKNVVYAGAPDGWSENLGQRIQADLDAKAGREINTPKPKGDGGDDIPPSGGGTPPKGTNPPKEPSGGDIEAPKIDETTKVEPDVTMDEALHVKPKEGVSDGVQGQKEALVAEATQPLRYKEAQQLVLDKMDEARKTGMNLQKEENKTFMQNMDNIVQAGIAQEQKLFREEKLSELTPFLKREMERVLDDVQISTNPMESTSRFRQDVEARFEEFKVLQEKSLDDLVANGQPKESDMLLSKYLSHKIRTAEDPDALNRIADKLYERSSHMKDVEERLAFLRREQREEALAKATNEASEKLEPYIKSLPNAMSGGKAKKHLEDKIRYNGVIKTNAQMVDDLYEYGATFEIKSVPDVKAIEKDRASLKELSRNAPLGNENHPKTKEYYALKEKIDTPNNYLKETYRATLQNNSGFIDLSKTQYEYGIYLKNKSTQTLPSPKEVEVPKVETPVAKEVDSETFRQRMNDIIEEKLAQQSEAPAPKAPTTGEDELRTPSMENIFHPDNEVMGKSIFLASNPKAKRFVAGEKIEEQIIEGLEFFWNKTDKDIVEVTSGLRFPVETTDKAKAIQEAIALLKSEPQNVNLIKKAVAQSEGMLEKRPFEPMNFKEGSAFVDGFEVPLDIAIASSKTVSTPKELSRKLFEAQESLDRMITSTSNNDYNKKRKRLSEMRHNQQEDTALYQTLKAELENIEAFKDKDFLSKLQKAEEKVKKLEAEVTQTYHQDGQKVASKIQDQVPSDELMESVERSMETVSKSKSAQHIEDVGVKIGGARKDTWVGRGLNLDDVKTMSGGEASKYVVKENIIPKIDYEALHAEGKLSKEAIATIKIVRDGLGAKPKSDSAQGREAYMTSMAIAKGLLDDMISGTVPFSSIRNEARARFGYADGKLSEEARALLVPILKGRYSPFDVSSYDVSRLLRKGFLGDAYKLTQFDVKVDGDFVKQWGIYDNKKGTLLRDENGKWFKFENEESASAFMQTYEPPKKTKGVKEEPKRPHLDSQIRQGDDVREGIDVDAEMLRKTFGFRGVEFGNWAANDERQKFINLGYDALSDLSDILNIPKEAIALDGKLGFAFGARGVSGASAHYEPAKVVINLTKMNGAGAMAHEWGHALDHYLGELNTLNSYGGAPKYLSGGTDAPKIRHLNPELREEVQTAARGVMEAMFEKDMPKADVIRQHELSIENYDKKLTNWGHYANQASLTAKEKQNAKQAMDELQYLKQNAQKQIQAITDGAFNPRKTPSEYRTNAQAITGKGDYWQRPTEMWARAFESYVYDKLAKVDRVNSYLVWGVENAHYVEKPYPEGMEREAINKAFDTLFATLKAEKTDKGMRLGYIDEASAKFMAKTLSGAGLGAIPEHDYNGDGVIDASDRLIGSAMGIVAFHTLTSKSAFASYKTMAEHGVQKLAQRAQAGDMIAQSVLGTRYVITSEKGTVMLAEEVTHGFKAFKDVALSDGKFDKEFNFGLISESAVEKLKRMTGLNFQGYQRIVDANHIRHTKNTHPDDLYIYDDLLDIFENFDYARRTPEGLQDSRTRKPIIGVELYRKHENGLIEYVELRDFNNKTLKLKTTLTVDKELADQKLPRDLRLWTDADYRSNQPQSLRLKTDSDGFNENSIAQKGQK